MVSITENDEQFLEWADTDTEIGEHLQSTPAWEWRVFLTSLVGLIPGIQLGCILALFLSISGPDSYFVFAGGGLLGMLAGGMLEADYFV